MNTDADYQRRTDRSLTDLTTPGAPAPEASPLAVHGDPSQARPPAASGGMSSPRSITWVRPSELPTLVGAPLLRRGADVQAEMARRARSAPAAATSRVGRRITRTAIGRPAQTNPIVEGHSL